MSYDEKPRPLYHHFASLLSWNPPDEYRDVRDLRLKVLMDNAPSGAGWDCGTKLATDPGDDIPKKIQFYGSFHHMDEHGMYSGWTDHTITVKPCLRDGIDITVSGRNRNDIKDHLFEMFDMWLRSEMSYKQIETEMECRKVDI